LNEAETTHLLDLAKTATQPRRSPRTKPEPRVSPRVAQLVDTMRDVLAIATSRLGDPVASNALGRALFPHLFPKRANEKSPTTGVARYVNHFRRVTVAAGATRVVTAPPLPCDVPLQVRTAIGGRAYWGTPLSTGSTPRCGANLPAEPVYVAPVPADDPDPCRNPAIAALPDPHRVVLNMAESGCFGSRINLNTYGFNLSIVVLEPGWSFADYGSTATMVRLKVTNGSDTFVYRAEDAVVRIQ
jgi:hypothetical protein